MFVQALAEYADEHLSEELAEDAWEEKPVPVLIAIGPEGTFSGIIPRFRDETRGNKTFKRPEPLQIPRSPVNRNSGLHPLLAADDIKYVLGAGAWTAPKDEQNATERHQAFVGLIEKAAAATHDTALETCALFFARNDQVQAARDALKDSKPGVLIALSVDGPVVKRTAVRKFWNDHYRQAYEGRMDDGGIGQCIISGLVGPIAPTHEKIKGMSSLGGQPAGVSLMSFDKPAFRSYGWEQNANSPVSPNRSMAYVMALNDLLRSDNGRRRDVAGVGFIYWTKKNRSGFDLMTLLEQPSEKQVSELLRPDPDADPDPDKFYMAGIAGNGARLLIRYWVEETLATVKANVKDWFEGLRIVDVFTGSLAEPPNLWHLRCAISRDGNPPADRVLDFVRRAIEGPTQPLGYRMLGAALARLGVSSANRLDPARIGLIRLCLNDRIHVRNEGGILMNESLDPGQKHEAYLCGRLMAVYESLQYAASGQVNQTVADRYYSLASTYPGLAFPKLKDLGNKHLRKLRRDNYGAMVRIEQDMDRLYLEIEQASGFKLPAALSLDGQGRFALGYHHQRAHQMAQAKATKKSKEEPSNSEENLEQI